VEHGTSAAVAVAEQTVAVAEQTVAAAVEQIVAAEEIVAAVAVDGIEEQTAVEAVAVFAFVFLSVFVFVSVPVVAAVAAFVQLQDPSAEIHQDPWCPKQGTVGWQT
jgi:hypothetical protein